MGIRQWMNSIWNRNAVPPLTEATAQAHIYFNDDVTFVSSHVSCTDRRGGPAPPITEFRSDIPIGELGSAVYKSLSVVEPPVSPERFEQLIDETFERLGVRSWNQLEKRHWLISIWQLPNGRIKFQTMRKTRGGGYVAFDSDHVEQTTMDEMKLDEVARRSMRLLNRKTYR